MQVYYFLGRKQRKLLFAFVFLTHIPDYNFSLFFVPLFFPVRECSAFTHGSAPRRSDLIPPVTKMISVLVYCPVLRINISRTFGQTSKFRLRQRKSGNTCDKNKVPSPTSYSTCRTSRILFLFPIPRCPCRIVPYFPCLQ